MTALLPVCFIVLQVYGGGLMQDLDVYVEDVRPDPCAFVMAVDTKHHEITITPSLPTSPPSPVVRIALPDEPGWQSLWYVWGQDLAHLHNQTIQVSIGR